MLLEMNSEKKMKVAFRLSSMKYGGAERVFISVAETLKRDYDVNIDFVIDQSGVGETESVVLDKGFQLHSLSCDRTLHSILPFKRYIDDHKPDVIISGYTDTNMAAILSVKLAKHKTKVIVSEHAALKEHWQFFSRKRKLLLNTYVRYGYRFSDHILAVSKGVASSIESLGFNSNQVGVIYNPIRFQPRLDSPAKFLNPVPVILAVGRVTKQKDYLTLLQAISLVNEKIKVKLLVVGAVTDTVEKAKLDHYIEANNLEATVDFIGFTKDVQDYYAKSDVFVLSSAWEGFGNVIVEALAFGLPVVSTDCNHGPAEILCHAKYGQLVPVGDSKAMASALIKALKTKDLVDQAALKNRSLAFSESKIASQYLTMIQKVIAS